MSVHILSRVVTVGGGRGRGIFSWVEVAAHTELVSGLYFKTGDCANFSITVDQVYTQSARQLATNTKNQPDNQPNTQRISQTIRNEHKESAALRHNQLDN